MMIPPHFFKFPQKEDLFMVGGSVRDLLMGKLPKDYDLVFRGDTARYARDLVRMRGGRLVCLGEGDKAVFRVVFKDFHIDITAMRGDTIEADLGLRDFTINAMAIALNSGELIDAAGGLKDIGQKRLRMVAPTVFHDDPVRVLRAHRLCALLDFEIEAHTLQAMKHHVQEIHKSAGERLHEEFHKTLQSVHSYGQLTLMMEIGTLFALFPELGATTSVRRKPIPGRSPSQPLLLIYAIVEFLINSRADLLIFPPTCNLNRVPIVHPALFKFAVLLFETALLPMVNGTDGSPSDAVLDLSRKLIGSISHRLRLSNFEHHYLHTLINGFLDFRIIFNANEIKPSHRRRMFRFFRKNNGYVPEIILHAYAGALLKTAHRDTAMDDGQWIKDMARIYADEYLPLSVKPPLATGRDLIRRFGLCPSPRFKKILNHVEEARLCGKIQDRHGAMSLIADLLSDESE